MVHTHSYRKWLYNILLDGLLKVIYGICGLNPDPWGEAIQVVTQPLFERRSLESKP